MTEDFYPSERYPIEGQIHKSPCQWCSGDQGPGEPKHVHGFGCMAEHEASCLAKATAKQFEFVAKLLRREACVFGEEPLEGAVRRARFAMAQLETLLEKRIELPAGGTE